MSGYPCLLMRKQASGWQEFGEAVRLELSQAGLAFRIAPSQLLLADVPKQAIEVIEEVCEHEMYLIKCGGHSELAFKLLDAKLGRPLADILTRWSYPLRLASHRQSAAASPIFPDLDDKSVQEFVLKLLFSDEFQAYMSKLGDMLEQWSTTISPARPP